MNPAPIQLEVVLARATKGLQLADQVLELLKCQPRVFLDFSAVERVTPSFANAFVMTLLEKMPLEEARKRVVMENRQPHVEQALSRSAQRYVNGIRLSSQRFAAAG